MVCNVGEQRKDRQGVAERKGKKKYLNRKRGEKVGDKEEKGGRAAKCT